jgi:hypothetical protein
MPTSLAPSPMPNVALRVPTLTNLVIYIQTDGLELGMLDVDILLLGHINQNK